MIMYRKEVPGWDATDHYQFSFSFLGMDSKIRQEKLFGTCHHLDTVCPNEMSL
jgi:hypothetical protein